MFNLTITLFCLHAEETWHPVVIPGCQLIVDRAARREKAGLDNADGAKLFIQKAQLDKLGIRVTGPKEYDAQTDVHGKIAFHEGIDFFLNGSFPEDPLADEAYPSGLYDYLNRVRDGVYLITSAAEYYVIPHWEITGK